MKDAFRNLLPRRGLPEPHTYADVMEQQARAVERTVAEFPPLSQATLDQLAVLLGDPSDSWGDGDNAL